MENQLADIFQVSKVILIADETVEKYKLDIDRSIKKSCPRCRKNQSERENQLCKRCYDTVNVRTENNKILASR